MPPPRVHVPSWGGVAPGKGCPPEEARDLGRSEQEDSAAGLKAAGSVEMGVRVEYEGHGSVQIALKVWHCSMGIPGKTNPWVGS